MSNTLRKSGSSLHIRIGNAIQVLENLDNEYGIKRILSHEETGNSWSYGRDKKVLQWCQEKEINWIEYPNNGVIRRLKNRDQWKAERDSRMRIPLNETPMFSKSIMFEGEYPSINDLSLTPRPLICRPEPGEDAALRRLHLFLDQDSKKYSWSISSPTLSTKHGSVLSPYLTTVSYTHLTLPTN